MQPLHGWAVNCAEFASVTFTFIKRQRFDQWQPTGNAFTTNACKTAPGASKHIKWAYHDTFGEVVEYSGFESERLLTDNRVREGEAHKEGLESSEISLGGHSKPDRGCTESPCCPLVMVSGTVFATSTDPDLLVNEKIWILYFKKFKKILISTEAVVIFNIIFFLHN